ncbi:MAG: hypothetical protein U0326_43165 [Polyangiales bacterium]
MRKLTVPATLILAPLAFGCSTSAPSDAATDVIDLLDATDVIHVIDAVIDTSADRADAADARDVSDASDVSDAADGGDAPVRVCEGARDADGGVYCREENVQGSGMFCIRYRCEADDGGVSLGDCCRLVG